MNRDTEGNPTISIVPAGDDRLGMALARLRVTEANYLACARGWRALRRNRAKLHDMARRYPLSIELAEQHFMLESPGDVDRLAGALRTQLKKLLVAGTDEGVRGRRPR